MEESKKTVQSVPLTIEPNNNLHKKLLVTSKPTVNIHSGKQNTYRMQQSNVLDRVKSFLPQLISSTEELLSMDESEKVKYDIENIDKCEKIIEMNISLVDNGVLLSDDDSDTESDKSDEEIITNNNCDNLNEKTTTTSLVQEISVDK